ncbi:MFS transporter [Amycolatopsis taiwanensis]|uniref:MFS transporter n=1 Tax=Amycolatopsis taiwanensis TaxID=342230 RepID=UPI000486094E|nr:MFS transporter [Amycolatopsis taiwanensis]
MGIDDAPARSAVGGRGLGIAFWRLWGSAGLSDLANGTLQVAVPLMAVGLTQTPTLIAGATFAFTLPWLLFALPAGALVDRLDRRRVMLGANVVRASLVAVFLLAVLLDAGTIWALYVIAFGVGVAETIYESAAQSIVPQVVRRDQLPRANGRLYAAQLTANEFVGPPLAGFLVTVGVAFAVAVPVGLWVVAVVALCLMRGSFRIERRQHVSVRADIGEGLRFLWHQRLLRKFTVMVGVFNLASSATFAVLVLYAVGPTSAMGLSGQAFGVLLTTVAAGSVVGSFVAHYLERLLGRARTLVLSFLAGTLVAGVPAVTANAYLIGITFFVGGAGVLVSNVVTVTLRQRITPDRLLGRVNSSHRLVAWGTKPLGAAVGGVLAQLLGLRAVFGIMGLVSLAALALLTGVTDQAMETAERDAV